jgi:hypothetical protein
MPDVTRRQRMTNPTSIGSDSRPSRSAIPSNRRSSRAALVEMREAPHDPRWRLCPRTRSPTRQTLQALLRGASETDGMESSATFRTNAYSPSPNTEWSEPLLSPWPASSVCMRGECDLRFGINVTTPLGFSEPEFEVPRWRLRANDPVHVRPRNGDSVRGCRPLPLQELEHGHAVS